MHLSGASWHGECMYISQTLTKEDTMTTHTETTVRRVRLQATKNYGTDLGCIVCSRPIISRSVAQQPTYWVDYRDREYCSRACAIADMPGEF